MPVCFCCGHPLSRDNVRLAMQASGMQAYELVFYCPDYVDVVYGCPPYSQFHHSDGPAQYRLP